MKNILKQISIFSAALLVTASCTADLEQITYNPAEAEAAVLSSLADSYTLDVDSPNDVVITFTWSEPDFGVSVAATNNLEFDVQGNEFANASTLTSINQGGEYAVTHETLNSAVMKLLDKYAMEYVETTFEFRVTSSFSDSAAALYSNTISTTLTPYLGTKQYPSIALRGDYNGWDFDNSQKLYSANEDENYEGMVYFGCSVSDGWKLCEDSGWSNNWGLSGGESDEASSWTATAGGDNIKIYALNSYYFTFNSSTLEVTMSKAHDTWGVVGSHNDWGGSTDNEMSLINSDNTYYLSAVVDFEAGDEWKIRPDNTWSDDVGCSAVKVDDAYTTEGGNFIMNTAGTYTIRWYFNGVDQTVEVIAGDAGDDSGTTEEPEVEEPSGDYANITLRGDYNGWDYTLAQRLNPISGSKYGAWIHLDGKGGNGWKLCTDADWTTSWGLPTDSETAETTPLVLLENSQTNINIYTSNIYYATFDTETEELSMDSPSTSWGLAGSKNSWGDTGEADIDMTLANDGAEYYLTATVDFEAGQEFKFRADNAWSYIISCDDVAVDSRFKTTYTNFTLPATGTYTINWYFNSEDKRVEFITDAEIGDPEEEETTTTYENITLRGDYNGWDYTLAQRIYPTSGSNYGAWIHLDGKGGNGWKLCTDSDWTTSWGLPTDSEEAETSPLVLVENSQTNINIYTNNIYYASFDTETEELTMGSASSSWGLAGSKNSWGDTGEADIDMELANDGADYYMTVTTDFEAGQEFKIRADNAWSYIIGCDDVTVEESYKTDYTNFTLPETGTYTIDWYFNTPTQNVLIYKH